MLIFLLLYRRLKLTVIELITNLFFLVHSMLQVYYFYNPRNNTKRHHTRKAIEGYVVAFRDISNISNNWSDKKHNVSLQKHE